MSVWVHLTDTETGEELFSWNITDNLGEMAGAAGIYLHIWDPQEAGIEKARHLIAPLSEGIKSLIVERQDLLKYSPANGWGTHDDLVKFAFAYALACCDYPDAAARHPYEREQECALRLAIAHPERAAMALGDGWSVAQWTDDGESTFTVIRWSRDLPEWWMLHVYPHGGVRIAEFGDLDIPQEFREALARADLISAAWQRIATQEATA